MPSLADSVKVHGKTIAARAQKVSGHPSQVTHSPKSAYEKVAGMTYFARMLDKIRLHARGELRPDFHANLGRSADGWCCGFLRINYSDLKARVLEGGTDEEILEWC